MVKRAGVSLAAFYDWFANKDEAVFAGYDRFIGVVVQRLVAAFEVSAGPPAELVHDVLGAYLAALQEDLVVARAYQVEIDALGPPARQRRRDSLTALAGLIRDRTEERDPAVVLPWSAYVGVVYAARQLASDALDTAPEPDLHGLGTDLEAWIRDLFRQR